MKDVIFKFQNNIPDKLINKIKKDATKQEIKYLKEQELQKPMEELLMKYYPTVREVSINKSFFGGTITIIRSEFWEGEDEFKELFKLLVNKDAFIEEISFNEIDPDDYIWYEIVTDGITNLAELKYILK